MAGLLADRSTGHGKMSDAAIFGHRVQISVDGFGTTSGFYRKLLSPCVVLKVPLPSVAPQKGRAGSMLARAACHHVVSPPLLHPSLPLSLPPSAGCVARRAQRERTRG